MLQIPPDPIRINNKSYMFDKLPDEAKVCVQQLVDIDSQLNNLKFRMDQLQTGRASYVSRLNVVMKEQENATQEESPQERGIQENADA